MYYLRYVLPINIGHPLQHDTHNVHTGSNADQKPYQLYTFRASWSSRQHYNLIFFQFWTWHATDDQDKNIYIISAFLRCKAVQWNSTNADLHHRNSILFEIPPRHIHIQKKMERIIVLERVFFDPPNWFLFSLLVFYFFIRRFGWK